MRFRLAALAATLVVCQFSFASGNYSNRRAPGFSLPDSTAKQYDPSDFRGKVIVLEFMQTHCPTCKTMSGVLEQVKAKFGAKIQVMSVVVMPDTPAAVQQYIKENNVTSPVLFDCGQMTASYLKITPQNPTVKFPHIFLIDGDGTIRNDFDSADANSNRATAKILSDAIDNILNGAAQKKR